MPVLRKLAINWYRKVFGAPAGSDIREQGLESAHPAGPVPSNRPLIPDGPGLVVHIPGPGKGKDTIRP